MIAFQEPGHHKEFLSLAEKFVAPLLLQPATVEISEKSKTVNQSAKETTKPKQPPKEKEKPKPKSKPAATKQKGRPPLLKTPITKPSKETKSPILGAKKQGTARAGKHIVDLLKKKEESTQKTSSEKSTTDEEDIKLLQDIEQLCKKPSFLGEPLNENRINPS